MHRTCTMGHYFPESAATPENMLQLLGKKRHCFYGSRSYQSFKQAVPRRNSYSAEVIVLC
jgi:hypothetical protein